MFHIDELVSVSVNGDIVGVVVLRMLRISSLGVIVDASIINMKSTSKLLARTTAQCQCLSVNINITELGYVAEIHIYVQIFFKFTLQCYKCYSLIHSVNCKAAMMFHITALRDFCKEKYHCPIN